MKKLVKYTLKAFLLAILVIAVALAAAPFFVRQEQVKNFIENKVKLSDNQKLKLGGKIKFGFFPQMYVKIPQVSILQDGDEKQKFEEFYFGFKTSELMDNSVKFNSSFEYGEVEYEGNVLIQDYKNFIEKGQSDIALKLEEPLRIKAKGDFVHQDNIYSLRNFEITHKQTTATGNVKVTAEKSGELKVDLNTEIDSEDIENIRRVIQFGKNHEEFNLLSGEGKVSLNVSTHGITSEEFKQSLNGEGTVNVNDAAIYGIDLNELIGSPQNTELTENSDRKIDIEEAEAEFKITDGIVNVETLNANNQFANITGAGNVSIPASEVRMGVDIDADIASAKVKIPLVIYGNFNKIKFAPRVGDAILGNLDAIKDVSKIKLKDIKIDLKKGDIGGAVNQLREIGKGFGLDLDKVTGGATKDIGIQPAPVAVPVPVTPAQAPQPAAPVAPATPALSPAPQEPATTAPLGIPASMQQNKQ